MALRWRSVFGLLLALAFPSGPMAQAPTGEVDLGAATGAEPAGILFVASEPFGAQVWLDGNPLSERTPLLLRGLAPGSHRIRVEKEGYFAVEAIADPALAPVFAARLAPERVVLRFAPGEVRVAGQAIEGGYDGISIPAAVLEFTPSPEGLDVMPVYERQGLLDGVRFALPLFIGLSGVLTLREIGMPRDQEYRLSPELAAASILSAGLLAWDLVLEAKRERFLETYQARLEASEDPERGAQSEFDAAIGALGQGNFAAALSRLESLAAAHPETDLAPRSLFEAGRIRLMQGDIDGAEDAYGRLVDRYPVPELYDRALKGLSDCALARGDREGALAWLGLLTFVGAGLSREDIELHRRYLALPPEAQ